MKIAGQYAKFLTAIAGQALVYAQLTYGGSNKWVTLATAVAAVLGVYAVPNASRAQAGPLPPAAPGASNVTVKQ